MKVSYKTILLDAFGSHRERVAVEWCCDAAREAEDAIDFSLTAVSIRHSYLYYGDVDHVLYPISFCPFCGIPVECVEVERVREVVERKEVLVTRTEVVTSTRYEEVPRDE